MHLSFRVANFEEHEKTPAFQIRRTFERRVRAELYPKVYFSIQIFGDDTRKQLQPKIENPIEGC